MHRFTNLSDSIPTWILVDVIFVESPDARQHDVGSESIDRQRLRKTWSSVAADASGHDEQRISVGKRGVRPGIPRKGQVAGSPEANVEAYQAHGAPQRSRQPRCGVITLIDGRQLSLQMVTWRAAP